MKAMNAIPKWCPGCGSAVTVCFEEFQHWTIDQTRPNTLLRDDDGDHDGDGEVLISCAGECDWSEEIDSANFHEWEYSA